MSFYVFIHDVQSLKLNTDKEGRLPIHYLVQKDIGLSDFEDMGVSFE